MDPRAHWQRVYEERAPDEVSWYQATPERSLALIEATGAGLDAAIVDVGGGASLLVDHLLARGYRDVTVLDVADAALARARERIGANAHFVTADVLGEPIGRRFDVWHDRAVFHFFTEKEQRARYVAQLESSLAPRAHVIVATFALDGPERCSGLPIVRYAPESLAAELGPDLEIVEVVPEIHRTPAGATQSFIYCRFRRTR